MSAQRKFIGTCSNQAKVFDRFVDHNSIHPVDDSLLQEALSHLSPTKNFEKLRFNFGRVIGKNNCVTIDKTDKVVMAYRKGRNGPTPMVLNREPENCSSLIVILKKIGNNEYLLITTFIGENSEREPWDPYLKPSSPEYQRAVTFWSTHALIYDETIIDHIV